MEMQSGCGIAPYNRKRQGLIRVSLEPAVPLGWLLGLLPILFYLVNLWRMMSGPALLYYLVTVLAGGAGLLTILFYRGKYLNRFLCFSGIYLASLALNILLIGNLKVIDLFQNMLLLGITVLMIRFPWTVLQAGAGFYLTYAMLILRRTAVRYVPNILHSSGNYISIVILIPLFLYYIAIARKKGRELMLIDLLPAFLAFDVGRWARGRGGILACSLFLILILAFYLKKLYRKNQKMFYLVLTAAIIFFAVMIVYSRDLFQIDLGKWETRGTDNSEREQIWASLFSKALSSILYFVLGPPLADIPVLVGFDGNCHNSFLQLYAYAGLVAFVLFILMTIRAMISQIRTGNSLFFIITLTILVRGMTDKFIFSQYGMPIMLFLILFPYERVMEPAETEGT